MYIFFWVFPRRQIVVGRRFGTLYQFHLQRLGEQFTQPLKMELIEASEMSANYNLTPGKYPEENIQLHCFMKSGEFFYTLRGEGLLGSHEGLCCMQLILARGVPPVTARLVVVTPNGRVIVWLPHAVSRPTKYGKYWHECAEIGIMTGVGGMTRCSSCLSFGCLSALLRNL